MHRHYLGGNGVTTAVSTRRNLGQLGDRVPVAHRGHRGCELRADRNDELRAPHTIGAVQVDLTGAGRELVLAAYGHAVEQRYRFYSYGDCMLIL